MVESESNFSLADIYLNSSVQRMCVLYIFQARGWIREADERKNLNFMKKSSKALSTPPLKVKYLMKFTVFYLHNVKRNVRMKKV